MVALGAKLTVAFVHLSDIHFGQEKRGAQRAVNNDARRQVIEDAANVVGALSNGKASGIIITGDIAYAGKPHEYEAAGSWLDELARRVGCEPSDIQMIPGNHDVDREKIKGAAELMLEAIHVGGEERLDAFLEEEVDREVLYSRFRAYRPFADAYQCTLDCAGNNSADRRVELVEGRAIRFVRVNSALICTKGRKEEGHLLLGARQRVLQEASGEELVVLMHHPLNWISDSAEARKFLRSRARVFMSGHEHLATLSVQAVEPGCDLMMIAAGATTPDQIDETYTYAYNVIEFDWDKTEDALVVTIHPRRWNDEMKRFEADVVRLGGRSHRTVLGSPNFRRAPKPQVFDVLAAEAAPEPAPVEIMMPPEEDVAAHSEVSDTDYQNLYLRFFRDLADGDRLRILVELGAVPREIRGAFNHETESKLFRTVVRAKRFEELRAKVEDAFAQRQDPKGKE